jgi:hypothetical protein
MNLIKSRALFPTPRMPDFLLYCIVITGIILRVGTTRRIQEEQYENVW